MTGNSGLPRQLAATIGACALSLLLSACGGGDSLRLTEQANRRPTGVVISSAEPPSSGPARLSGLDCSGPQRTGWCWLQPAPSELADADVFFLDSTMGWRVGAGGRIFKSADGGNSWRAVPSGVDIDLKRVVFSSATDGLVFGKARALLKTKDGGATWQLSRIDAPGNSDINPDADIVALSAERAYAAGLMGPDSGALMSEDGGMTWQATDMDKPQRTASGHHYASAAGRFVRKSSDGGKTWQTLLDLGPPYLPSDHWMTLAAVDDKHLFLSRYYTPPKDPDGQYRGRRDELWISHDGGANWAMRKPQAKAGGQVYTPNMRVLRASDQDTVLLALNSGLLRSDDDGATWENIEGLTTAAVQLDALTTLSVRHNSLSNGETLQISTDLGRNWTAIAHPMTGTDYWADGSTLRSLDNVAVMMTSGSGQVMLSANQGRAPRFLLTLERYSTAASAPPWRSAWFFDADYGLSIDRDGHLLQSKDGGLSWGPKPSNLGPKLLAETLPGLSPLMGFSDRLNGWARLTDGSLLRTADGGTSWRDAGQVSDPTWLRPVELPFGRESIDPFRVSDYSVSTSGRVTIVGKEGQIAYSDDKGKSWLTAYSASSADLRRVISVGERTLWAAGRDTTLLKSVDGGQSWELVLSGNGADLNDVFFLDLDHGWAVGQDGVVLSTADGGKTWIKQSSGTKRELLTVQFTSPGVGWMTGAGGFLLTTGTGGF